MCPWQVGYFMYYYETWILPAAMRQEKTRYNWNAAWAKYHQVGKSAYANIRSNHRIGFQWVAGA